LLEFGSSLRLTREARGLSLADAEKATRVRARYLRALEEGDLAVLPGGAYPRVFLRDYAEYLGLDPVHLLDRIPVGEPEISPRPVRSPIRPLPWRGAALTALVLGCVAAASVWAFSARAHHAAPPAARAATPATAPKVAHTAAVKPPVPEVATLHAVRGDSWVQVSRGGRVLWTGTLRQGRTLKLGVRKPLVVRLGAPWNVDARVAGRRLPPFPQHPLDVALHA